jgi:hypothetical protein
MISDKIKSGKGTLSQLINTSTAYDNLNETLEFGLIDYINNSCHK